MIFLFEVKLLFVPFLAFELVDFLIGLEDPLLG